MVRVCEKPECFKDLEGEFIYFEGYDSNPYAYAAVSFNGKTAYLHFDVLRWTHNTLKKLIVDWDILKRIIKKQDVNSLIITRKGNLDNNVPFVKFLGRMGLSKPQEILIATYEI